MRPDIIFYQQYAVPYFGILALSSHLRQNKFKTDVIIDSLERDSINALCDLHPYIVGISVLSTEHSWLISQVQKIKEVLPETTIIVGGIHAMFYYEEILSDSTVDIVCHSEGEEVLINLIKELQSSSPDLSLIEGIAYRGEKEEIITTPRAPLVSFKDEIIEDRDIYYKRYPQLQYDSVHRFFSSRGCPYRCSFCYNASIQEIFKGKGVYIRQKSPIKFIQEIVSQCKKYPITSIFFFDDLFTFNKDWLRQFLSMYKEQVSLPFLCTTRANVMDEETGHMLADAGCRTVFYGIESGDYRLRKHVLHKDITDDMIIRCGNIIKMNSLKAQTTNMFCLPDENITYAFKTIELNIKAKTDYAMCALFLPFPKTSITDYCKEKGYIKKDYSLKDVPYSFFTKSVLENENKREITNVHFLAYYFIKWPWLFYKCKNIVSFTFLWPVYYFLFLFGNFLRLKGERGISFFHAIRYAWRLRKAF
ncbi:B12-binding domain-containing radical SAM protein [Candidatus Latescibacterota bacterium]